MEAVTDMHRKSLIRLMNGPLARKRRCKERERSYGPEVDDALRVIAESLDYVCAERLTPNLVWMAEHLATHAISLTQRQPLRALWDQTNPRHLRQQIYHLLDYLFTLSCASPGVTQDVYQTLTHQKGEDAPVTIFF
jgi:hypothetical protein